MADRLCRWCDKPLPADRKAYCNRSCRSAWRRNAFRHARNIGHGWAGAAMSVNNAEGWEARRGPDDPPAGA